MIAVLFSAILAGCSSSPSATNQASDASASAAPESSSAPKMADVPDAAAAANLPVYPGAAKVALRGKLPQTTTCGHKLSLVMYDTTASAQTVAGWYKSRVSNGTFLDLTDREDGDTATDTSMQILTPGGAAGVTISQVNYRAGNLASAAKTLGADETSIGLETYDPPLGADYVALMVQGTTGDAAAKAAARQKLASICPSG